MGFSGAVIPSPGGGGGTGHNLANQILFLPGTEVIRSRLLREPGRRAALILWLGLPTLVAQFFPRVSEKPQCFSSRDFLLAEVSPSTFILLGRKKNLI